MNIVDTLLPYRIELPKQDWEQELVFVNVLRSWYSPDYVRNVLSAAHKHYQKEMARLLESLKNKETELDECSRYIALLNAQLHCAQDEDDPGLTGG
jgi:hypothetical protein